MRQKYSVEKILNHIRNELLTAYYEINYTIYLVNCKNKSPLLGFVLIIVGIGCYFFIKDLKIVPIIVLWVTGGFQLFEYYLLEPNYQRKRTVIFEKYTKQSNRFLELHYLYSTTIIERDFCLSQEKLYAIVK